MNYWLIKSEPFVYSIQDLMKDGFTSWDGIRNYQARNYLKDMTIGDLALFYHSNEGKAVVGVAEVQSLAYPDVKDSTNTWVAIDVKYKEIFPFPVPLASLRADSLLSQMNIFRQMRLSVVSVTLEEFKSIYALGTRGVF